MDWGEIGSKLLKNGAKLLGGALGGPVGLATAAGQIVAEELGTDPIPEAVNAKLDELGPEAYVKMREIESSRETELTRLNTVALESVNQTMRVEATSEHWPQYTWRPWVGFWFPVAVMGVYVLLPLTGTPVPTVPEFVWAGWGAILGITTWGRNQTKPRPSGSGPGVLGSLIGKLAK